MVVDIPLDLTHLAGEQKTTSLHSLQSSGEARGALHLMKRQITAPPSTATHSGEWGGLGKGFIQEITEQRNASELVDIERWGKRKTTIPDHMEQRHWAGSRGKKRAGAGQRTRMVSSAALRARTSGHRMLVFMKPFLEEQGIFWLPPAGAEPQEASAGAPYSRARAQAATWRQVRP